MKRLKIVAFVLAIMLCNSVFCQYANLEFVENRGQWDASVKYKGLLNNGAFFLQEKGFRVLIHNSKDLEQFSDFFHGVNDNSNQTTNTKQSAVAPNGGVLHSHAYDVVFQNAQTPKVIADKALDTYNNYFIGNDSSKWRGECRIYQAVVYKNLYDKIDVRYYTYNGNLKYDIVVHPGADLSKLALKYEGVNGLKIKGGDLIIETSVGDQKELAPYAYQVVDDVKKEVRCKFKVTGNIVRFETENFSPASTLIIDPTLIFSTFTGSSSDNWGYTATYGPDGSLFAGGIVFGSGFPVSSGAYSQNYNGGTSDEEGLGGFDIGLIKFNPSGSQRVYATYIGGTNGNEQPHSLVVDAQSRLVMAGRTNSANFPGTKYGPGGSYDIVLTRFNATGTMLAGALKIGGTGRDGVNIRPKYANPTGVETIRRNYGDDARSEVILDNAGNIILAFQHTVS